MVSKKNLLLLEDVASISQVKDVKDLSSIAKKISGNLGFSQILIALKSSAEESNDSALITSTYSVQWRTRYEQEGYVSLDPVVAHSLASSLPMIWCTEIYRTEEELAFYEELISYGLTQGVTLPMHGAKGQVGLISLRWHGSSLLKYKNQILEAVPSASLLRDFLLDRVICLMGPSAEQPVQLTCRELEILKWSAVGKTSWEISMILSLSTDAVSFHLRNIRKKFMVNSSKMAVIKAVRMNIISL
jgi:LuxR family quorum-sensing transcriptional regulator LasR